MALSKSPLGAHFVSIWTPFSPPGDPSLLSIPSAPFRTPPPPPFFSFLPPPPPPSPLSIQALSFWFGGRGGERAGEGGRLDFSPPPPPAHAQVEKQPPTRSASGGKRPDTVFELN